MHDSRGTHGHFLHEVTGSVYVYLHTVVDVYYYNCWRLKLEGETESICVCTKERKGVSAEVLVATPCTNSLGGESGEQKHEHLQKYAFTWLRQK